MICEENASFFLCSLQPATKYYYIFGDVYGWSEEFTFKSPPQPGPDVTTRVLAFGGKYRIQHSGAWIINLSIYNQECTPDITHEHVVIPES